MAIYSDEAFVITSSEWKETSLIVRCFTRERGKLNFMAKGIKRPKSRIGSSLDSFSRVKIIYYLKRDGDLANLKEAYTVEHFPSVRADLARFAAASFYFETLDIGLAPHERHKDVFDLTAEFLDLMERTDWAPGLLPDYFLRLSAALGFGTEISRKFDPEKYKGRESPPPKSLFEFFTSFKRFMEYHFERRLNSADFLLSQIPKE